MYTCIVVPSHQLMFRISTKRKLLCLETRSIGLTQKVIELSNSGQASKKKVEGYKVA